MKKNQKYLIVILGPTASGKTDLSIQIAKKLKTSIISSDSRQFFKELNIGTAKPNKEQLRMVKHYFINYLSINEPYNAGKFEMDAMKLLKKLFLKLNFVVMVGGSGLYIDAICKGFDRFPKVPKSIRDKLISQYHNYGLSMLLSELKDKDKEYYSVVDIHNHQRIIRALEVIRYSGRKFSSFIGKNNFIRKFKIIKIGVSIKKNQLDKLINQRVDFMIKSGLFKEVKNLLSYEKYNALQTVGYKEIFRYYNKDISKMDAIEQIKINTRKYAKKQITWFRRDDNVKWLNPNLNEVVDYIKKVSNNC